MFACILSLCSVVSVFSCMTACCWLSIVEYLYTCSSLTVYVITEDYVNCPITTVIKIHHHCRHQAIITNTLRTDHDRWRNLSIRCCRCCHKTGRQYRTSRGCCAVGPVEALFQSGRRSPPAPQRHGFGLDEVGPLQMTRPAWSTWRVRSHQTTTTTTTTYTLSTDDYVCMATRLSDVCYLHASVRRQPACGYDGSTSSFGDRERGGAGKKGRQCDPGINGVLQPRSIYGAASVRDGTGRDRTADCTARWRLPR